MKPNQRTSLFILLLLFCYTVQSQTLIGASTGTYKIPISTGSYKGFSTTINYQYILPNERQIFYINFTPFSKSEPRDSINIKTSDGRYVGKTSEEITHNYNYIQIGLKRLIGGEADEKRLLPFLGGGIALVAINRSTRYSSNTADLKNDESKRFTGGLHLNGGFRYNLKPIVFEINSNIDFIINPLIKTHDVSNLITGTRLSALISL